MLWHGSHQGSKLLNNTAGALRGPRKDNKMVTVRWFWVDGSVDEFAVENEKQAKMMVDRLYQNPDVVSVEISEF